MTIFPEFLLILVSALRSKQTLVQVEPIFLIERKIHVRFLPINNKSEKHEGFLFFANCDGFLRQPLKFDAAFDFYYFLKFGKKIEKDVDFFITNLRQTNGLFEG